MPDCTKNALLQYTQYSPLGRLLLYTRGSRFLLFIILMSALGLQLKVQPAKGLWAPEAEWIRTYDINQDPYDQDMAKFAVETSDGDFVVFGDTGGPSPSDYFLMKTDVLGNTVWKKTYDIGKVDYASFMFMASDGGYVLTGSSYPPNYTGNTNFVLMKADSNGNLLWNCTYDSGAWGDSARCVCQTSDSGYAIVGTALDPPSYYGDVWLVKTDENGTMQWNKHFGGSAGYGDGGNSVVQTSDGGYYVLGYTYSYGAGESDVWLIKTDSEGNMEWNKTYGGTSADWGRGLICTEDGKLTLFGVTYSYGGTWRDMEAWLVRTDALGNEEWNKTLGTAYADNCYSAVLTHDGGYAVTGTTYKSWPEPPVLLGISLFKTDFSGNLKWSGLYVDPQQRPSSHCVLETSDKGYLIAGDIAPAGPGGFADVLLVKIYPPDRHDVAVTGVSSSKAVVGQGLTTTLNVSVENQGQYAETFEVRVYANDTLIGNETMVNFETESQLQFTWNTTGFTLGTYNVSATVDAVEGETDLQDNTRSGCMVEVRSPRHDVGVFDVAAYPALVLNGSELNVDLTASNLGDYPEAFNVTVLANETAVARQEVNLPELQSTPLSVTWNTSGFELGNYTLSAAADAVDEEMNLSDNFCSDGQVTVRGPGDVAVLQARTAKKDCLPAPTLGQGFTVRVTAEAQNQSPWHETFNVSLFFQENILETQQVELLGGESRILEFTWDATAVPYGNQSVTVRADAVVAETEVGDNVFESDQVLVTIPGDVNGDHYVNAKDAVLLGVAFHPFGQYSPNADINDDDFVNAKDAVILGTYFGAHW